MIYLTKIELDAETVARKRFFDVYHWHKAVWELFPGRPDAERDFLFRLDQKQVGYRLLVLSQDEPRNPEWCDSKNFAVKNIPSSFLAQKHYLFDLRANPTRKIKKVKEDGSFTDNGKRIVLTKLDDQIAWIKRKAKSSGFSVVEDPKLVIEPAQNYGFIKDKKSPGLHVGVRFKGTLEVTDHALFAESFRKGIGSAKGFGFGMLLLQPIQL